MTKKIIFLIFFVLSGCLLHAQYTTPGTGVTWNLDELVENSGGIVTLSDDVYIISENITISANDTLRQIENAEIHVAESVLITVGGVLEFAPPEDLLITSEDTLFNFMGFRFEYSDASFMERCTIEFAGGIKLINSDIRIQDCVIRKNDKSNCTGTLDLFESSPEILDCDIYLNEGPAVLSAANGESSPYISGNWIYHNNTQNTNMPQINLGTSEMGKDIIIYNNIIDGFYDKAGGIAITTLAGGNLNCVIDSNTIINNRYGITAYGFDINSVISNNVLANNNIENLPMQGGSGINFWGGTSNMSMVYGNEIYGNLWGITNTGDAMPNLGQVEPDTINPGKNLIYDNGNLGVTYALYNNTPNNIFAENNYWGSYNLDSVEAVIFHYPDDETLGFVDYLPIKEYITGINRHASIKLALDIMPNPVTDYFYIKNLNIEKTNAELLIFDINGKRVFDQFIEITDRINISNLLPGNYYILIFIEKSTLTGRFIKH